MYGGELALCLADMRISLTRSLSFVMLLGAAAPVWAKPQPSQPYQKLDQSLRQSVAKGCDGDRAVIIRTSEGYRPGLADALSKHGNKVKGEFPSINGISARVSCEDLKTL